MEKILWTEIKRFIKSHVKQVLIIALAVGLVYTFAANMLTSPEDGLTEDETSDSADDLAGYASGFQVYIEYEDGSAFMNTTLLEDFINKPNVIAEAETVTGVDITGRIEELEEAGFEKTGEDRGALGVIRGDYSDVFTILVNVGSDRENLAVAEYYFDVLTSGDVNFLENKTVYVWSEPQVLVDSDAEALEAENTQDDLTAGSFSDYMTDLAIGTVFGLGVASLALVLLALLSNKKLYSFSYNRGSEDMFLLYSPARSDAEELAQLIAYPLSYDKIIIRETPLPEKFKAALDRKLNELDASFDYTYVEKMADAVIVSEKTEVIIMLNSQEDTKKWYRRQRKLADTYHLPVKVVQINS